MPSLNEANHAFYWTREWKRARELVRKRDGGLCQDCLKKAIYNPGTVVHHINELNNRNVSDPKVATRLDNLVLLCKNCHKERHSSERQQRYYFDEQGNIVRRR